MSLHRKPHLYNIAVFIAWTVTSFLCHYFAKAFLSSLSTVTQTVGDAVWTNIWSAGLITTVQMALCHLTVDMKHARSGPALLCARLTHALATYATNISMAMMFASSTFAIKLMEPITSAITQYCVLGTPLSPVAMLSLPVIVGGAISFSGNPFAETNLSVGIGAAFASNILLAFRNLAIKKMGSGEQSALTLRIQNSQIPFLLSSSLGVWVLLLYLEKTGVIALEAPYTIATCFLSGVFHVTYSYVSTGLVLSQLSVVSHAVANIMKRVLVVLLLYMFGRRVATPYNFLGLVVCTLGLLLYAWDKRHKVPTATKYNTKSGLIVECTRRTSRIPRSLWLVLPCFTVAIFVATQTFPGSPVLVKDPRNLAIFGRSLEGMSPPKEAVEEPVVEETLVTQPLPYDTIIGHTFGGDSLKRPENWELEPDLHGYLANYSFEIRQFLDKRLILEPGHSNFISEKLRDHVEVAKEAQRIHYNMFEDAIGKYKYCMLIDTADFENKGDPAITVGEILYLARANIEVIYYCNTYMCTDKYLQQAANLARKYSPDELVIIVHGGGNIHGYKIHDEYRFKMFVWFRGYQFFVFPQSIWVDNTESPHFKNCTLAYCCNANLTIVLRDLRSYATAQKYFNGSTRLIMAPDMAFHIGPVKRFVPPVFDIMWIKRNDPETPGYTNIPKHPPHLRLHVSDWHKFYTPKSGSSMEKSIYATVMGLFFTQRGRVVITDRLHGHIFATLLNIPHVLLDNKALKLSSYHNTWTRGLENTRLTNSTEEALKMALELLDIYDKELPPRIPWLNISTVFNKISYSEAERWFP